MLCELFWGETLEVKYIHKPKFTTNGFGFVPFCMCMLCLLLALDLGLFVSI